MTDCKHDWHFIHGTSRLECRRCKAETGPSTPEQLVGSLLKFTTTGPWTTELPTYEVYIPPKPVGGWVIDPAASEGHGPCTMFTVYRKPTDEQVKNTEAMFGWKWKDLP